MDVTQILQSAQSADATARRGAEDIIEKAKRENLPVFLVTMSAELSNEEKPPDVRRLAGLITKNCLDSKAVATQQELSQAWIQIDANIKAQIKMSVTTAMASPVPQARHTAAQVVAKVAAIELPLNQWPELIDSLTANVTAQSNAFLKQSTLECLGYICEEIEPGVLSTKSNAVLTAVIQGMHKDEPSEDVRRAATIALNNALEFVKTNFENDKERNYIMETVCTAAVAPSQSIKMAAFECMVKIAGLYYSKLAQYMQALFQLTFEEIQKGTDEVAQQAVEFWSTICDEEIELHEEMQEARDTGESPEQVSQDFVKGAMPFLVPLLLQTLTKQEEDQDDDTWNVAMAAGTCLALVAQACGDGVVQHVMTFVQAHITSQDWRFREAATLAFGSILEGPSKEQLQPLVLQAVPIMVNLMRDASVQVRDTAAWTLGRICELHPETLHMAVPNGTTYLHEMLREGGVLLEGLKDAPRVASNVCWAIHNLTELFDVDEASTSSELSPYFLGVVRALIACSERPDGSENNLRSASYEALNAVLAHSAADTMGNLREIVPYLCDKLERTFQMQLVSNDDKEEQNELQGLLCGTLQVVIQKLEGEVAPMSDRLMQLFLEVFNNKNATVHEEALMAVGAVANGVGKDFAKYMERFKPWLVLGLQNHEQHSVCSVAVGVIGDVCRALEKDVLPYCDELVTHLLQNLQNPQLNRNVKPPMLSIFGDIALAICGAFEKYLHVTMAMLLAASQTVVDTGSYDMVEYLNQLREGILEAYTGILQGLREEHRGEIFAQYVQHVVALLHIIAQDAERDDAVLRNAVGVIGDLAHTLGDKAGKDLSQMFIKQLLQDAQKSPNSQTVQVAKWAATTVKGIIAGA